MSYFSPLPHEITTNPSLPLDQKPHIQTIRSALRDRINRFRRERNNRIERLTKYEYGQKAVVRYLNTHLYDYLQAFYRKMPYQEMMKTPHYVAIYNTIHNELYQMFEQYEIPKFQADAGKENTGITHPEMVLNAWNKHRAELIRHPNEVPPELKDSLFPELRKLEEPLWELLADELMARWDDAYSPTHNMSKNEWRNYLHRDISKETWMKKQPANYEESEWEQLYPRNWMNHEWYNIDSELQTGSFFDQLSIDDQTKANYQKQVQKFSRLFTTPQDRRRQWMRVSPANLLNQKGLMAGVLQTSNTPMGTNLGHTFALYLATRHLGKTPKQIYARKRLLDKPDEAEADAFIQHLDNELKKVAIRMRKLHRLSSNRPIWRAYRKLELLYKGDPIPNTPEALQQAAKFHKVGIDPTSPVVQNNLRSARYYYSPGDNGYLHPHLPQEDPALSHENMVIIPSALRRLKRRKIRREFLENRLPLYFLENELYPERGDVAAAREMRRQGLDDAVENSNPSRFMEKRENARTR
ncbi:hypothetical protein SAMN05444392_101861 [Seinonella peptonophila]|uniref:Uncharacterized protein n=1 Tax=Seinonella peptonophila TaxID=112248 RepID=A0A1M4U7T9_9BACL|nr:hypothetical protein [Seinonella peptonophila]SHE52842.1 hypothetical protein SAMN05444392_101861 [Seinonella peptonophila]